MPRKTLFDVARDSLQVALDACVSAEGTVTGLQREYDELLKAAEEARNRLFWAEMSLLDAQKAASAARRTVNAVKRDINARHPRLRAVD